MKYFTAVLMLVCAVQALAHSNGDIRLIYGDSSSIGIVRMYYQGRWGRICNLGNSAADQVICRSAGFSDSSPIRFPAYGRIGRILLDTVRCLGNESNILQCEHAPIGDGNCGYHTEMAVDCYGGDIGSSVELSNGTSTDGVLLIGNNHGQIRTVCYNWYLANSIVACRMLGVDTSSFTPIQLDRQYYGETTETTDSYISHGVELECDGNETNLTQCPHRGRYGPYMSTHCRRSDDVALDCHGSANMEVSLVNGNATTGEVRVVYRGENGTMCAPGITGVAKVLCRMLGYGDYEGVRLDSRDITNVTNLRFYSPCLGQEKNLAECGTMVGELCNEALAISCRPQADIAVRLVDGNDTSGRLEIQRNGQWGSVCFTDIDIHHYRLSPVVCRMLNLPTENAVARPTFPALDNALILHSITCAGDEDNLNQCYLNTREDCDRGYSDAWISCA